jgi:predicted GNAT family acetyltransferase
MTDPVSVSVTDNPDELRYELHVDGELAGEIRYRRVPGAVVLVHTEVDPRFGKRVVQGALDDLRARELRVVPICPFVADYVSRHPEYADLVTREAT